MHLATVNILLAAISITSASPRSPRSPFVVKERHAVPHGWVEAGLVDKSETIHLQIGLRQGTEDGVEQHLQEISDPSHARYGQHLTANEVRSLIAPTEETVELVKAWLSDYEIADYYFNPSKDWVSVSVSIEKAEQMLDTSFSSYTHDDGSTLNRVSKWSLPAYLHEHIDVVQPTTSFFWRRAKTQVLTDLTMGEQTGPIEEFEDHAESELANRSVRVGLRSCMSWYTS